MKKLINDPKSVVPQMLEGLATLHPGHALLENENVLLRADLPPPAARRGVALISGGGAGHEPAHAGYVGEGMLSAAVTGEVFTSPSTDAVLAAIRAVAGADGVLLIVKNYTGDRLNFGLAAERARGEGIAVELVVVADDVSLRDTVEAGRRRGVAGTVLVHKVAGAAAAAGLPLSEVAREASEAAAAVGTMGVALGACTVPAAGRAGFTLGDDEMELGLGIHGERGVRRAPLEPADAIVGTILETILDDAGIAAGEQVALLVNGLGGTPPMELAIVAATAVAQLRGRGIQVARAWCGSLLTALEMPGCSLSVMRLDPLRLRRLDAPTTAPAWPRGGALAEPVARMAAPRASVTAAEPFRDEPEQGRALRDAALAIAAALEAEEPRLTDLDSIAGDGDLGISMARGAAAIREIPPASWSSAAAGLAAMGEALSRAIGGSSGPFYAAALLRAARSLGACDRVTPGDWAAAFDRGVASVSDLGGARPGDRTMLDALRPAADAFEGAIAAGRPVAAALSAMLEAGERGAAATAGMKPRLGRAAYLGDRAAGVPDAGAAAVAIWLRALAGHLSGGTQAGQPG